MQEAVRVWSGVRALETKGRVGGGRVGRVDWGWTRWLGGLEWRREDGRRGGSREIALMLLDCLEEEVGLSAQLVANVNARPNRI